MSPPETLSDFQRFSPFPGCVGNAGDISDESITLAPAEAAISQVLSVEPESMTISSSMSVIFCINASWIDDTIEPMVCSSLSVGMQTEIFCEPLSESRRGRLANSV